MQKYMNYVKEFFPTLVDRMRVFAVDPNNDDSRNDDQFRIGFGAFVDRPVAPFFYDHPAHIKNPCARDGNNRICSPTFTFDITSRLTSNVERTKKDLTSMSTSDNIDPSEAVLDAILQSIRCERDSGVGWHSGAFKLLVVTTDASYKAAGDGLIGGLFNANDGQCHKGANWPFYETNIDYPSIGQIYEAVEGSGVGIYFLTIPSSNNQVNPLDAYKELAKILPNAEAGLLSSNGGENEYGEAIDMIVAAYEKMAEKVLLRGSANHPDHLHVVVYKKCGKDEDYVKCEDINKCLCEKVAKKEKVNFMIEYTWNEDCPEGDCMPFEQEFSIFGTDETTHAGIHFLNHCDCQGDSNPPSYIKCQNGKYHCGECACDEGFEGALCECADSNDIAEDLEHCAPPIEDFLLELSLCSGKGTCECGKCACNKEDTGFRVDGEFCECDTSVCPSTGGMECSGHGTCDCKSTLCACDEGWEGKDCACSSDVSGCMVGGVECAGNGECECGVCRCKQTSFGYYDPNDNCQTYIDTCDTIQDCALCLYAAKDQNSLEDGSDFVVREECGNKCPDDFKDLQMRKDGSYVLKNAPLHFTEESKVQEEGNDMQRCTYMTIVDGESCTLEAFMARKNDDEKTESNIIIGAPDCNLFPINAASLSILVFLAFLVIGLIILLISWFGIWYYRRKEYLDHKKALEANQYKQNPLYTEPVTEHSAF